MIPTCKALAWEYPAPGGDDDAAGQNTGDMPGRAPRWRGTTTIRGAICSPSSE